MNKITNILNQVNLVKSKYDEIANVTGENFNIFSVLKMERKEVKTHSAFISELLNPKGKHGLGAKPLELFIETLLDSYSEIDNIKSVFTLETKNAISIVEEFQGKINSDKTEGGRIDIIVKDNHNNAIVIENKIDAIEQEKQIVRYNNAYPNSPIVFLTLTGYDSKSSGELEKTKDYFTISYEKEIVNWLVLCQKEAFDHPMLREIIKQYCFLIKKITNQSTNKEMTNEIANLLSKDSTSFEAAILINQNIGNAKKKILMDFGDQLLIALQKEIPNAHLEIDTAFGMKYKKLRIKNIKESNRFLLLSHALDLSDAYIEIHPGHIDGKFLSKNPILRSKFEDKLSFLKNRKDMIIQNTEKAWQGEWVCKYNFLNNKFSELVDKPETIIEQVKSDLLQIYNVFDELNKDGI